MVATQLPDVTLALVGYELDSAAVQVAQQRSDDLGIAVEWHQGDFLEVGRQLESPEFDAVITYPPDVRTQQLGHETAQMLATEFGLTGRIDLTHPFVAKVSGRNLLMGLRPRRCNRCSHRSEFPPPI